MAENGRLVTDLTARDFRVLDEGRPADVTVFSNAPQPMAVAVMLDMAPSMQPRLRRVRDGARAFVDALTARDRATIGSFNDEVAILEEVRRRAIADEVMVYAIVIAGTTLDEMSRVPCFPDSWCRGESNPREGFGSHQRPTPPRDPSGLIKLAEDTGGGHFVLGDRDDLQTTFSQVAEELRHQYALGFIPGSLDGNTHRVEVRALPPGLHVQARTSYIAAR